MIWGGQRSEWSLLAIHQNLYPVWSLVSQWSLPSLFSLHPSLHPFHRPFLPDIFLIRPGNVDDIFWKKKEIYSSKIPSCVCLCVCVDWLIFFWSQVHTVWSLPQLRKAVQKSVVSMLKEGGTGATEDEKQPVETSFSPICNQVVKFSVHITEKGGNHWRMVLIKCSTLLNYHGKTLIFQYL